MMERTKGINKEESTSGKRTIKVLNNEFYEGSTEAMYLLPCIATVTEWLGLAGLENSTAFVGVPKAKCTVS